METLLTALRACAEPTRMRLLALAARGSFCVMDFTEILAQSQPRLSRHLRLLHEAGLLLRVREGANVWLALPASETAAGSLVRALLDRLGEDDPVLAADRREAARVLAERARAATETFRRSGADWDEMRALGLPAATVEAALLDLLPAEAGRLLDIGTGTGRLLELLAPRVVSGVGVDASRAMLALARARLSRPQQAQSGLDHCAVRLGDMYRLPMPDGAFDTVLLQMVLHHAEDPVGALAEAARVLRPGGTLVAIDLAAHADTDAVQRLAHRWPGFTEIQMRQHMTAAGLTQAAVSAVPGRLEIRLWSATKATAVPAHDIAHLLETTP